MNVLVVGCGRLGRRLAEMLDQNGDDVAVIDSDPLNFLQLSDAFSGLTVTGVPMDMKVLQSAGIESCDAVAVVTPDDNLNITVSQIAREFFHVENVVARISDPARENVFKSFGLRSVCHTKMAGDAIFASLTQPWEAKYLTFGTSSMAFHSRRVEPEQVGLDAKHLPCEENEVVLGAVHTNGTVDLCRPGQALPLQEKDQVLFARVVD